MPPSKDIYDPQFVEDLFDKMSDSYDRVNYITSFGFSARWRRKCVEELNTIQGAVVVDLMCGMGECWQAILDNSKEDVKLIALDFSSEMIKRAEKRRARMADSNIKLLKEDVFDNSIPDNAADILISGFGLKTFNDGQLSNLANEINRILKVGGSFSLVDVSVPKSSLLRFFYMFYLKKIIPILGWIFLGNPATYRMLGIYTQRFVNAKHACDIFSKAGLDVEYVEYFYGCASGIRGVKSRPSVTKLTAER